MCRWLAYQGQEIALARYVTQSKNSLISQSLEAHESTKPTNGDGFGLGWYGTEPQPGLYREVRPAWSDENLLHLCQHIRSRLFFAHVRAATGTAVTRVNCHPFAHGQWLFMHNGFVDAWETVRRPVEALIPDPLYRSRTGTTDSEALFLGLLGGDVDADPVAATMAYLARVTKVLLDVAGKTARFRFTAALANGRQIFAFRYAVNDSANTLYFRAAADGLVIASEPLDEERNFWRAVPENHVLVSDGQAPIVVAM